MKYENTVTGIFRERPNRFIALVDVNGKAETVHVKNTGRCLELLIPGAEVTLQKCDVPSRKTKYDLISVFKKDFGWINIDSQAPNKVAAEWLARRGFDLVRPEYTYGNSRFDFYMEKGGSRFLMEVKGCTLEEDGIGYFPDAVSSRAAKHVRELSHAVGTGYRCAVAFVIAMEGVTEVRANDRRDPVFAAALTAAKDAGVEVWLIPCSVSPDTLCAK